MRLVVLWAAVIGCAAAQPALQFDPLAGVVEGPTKFEVFYGKSTTPMLGDYEERGGLIRFTPRLPFLTGAWYRARSADSEITFSLPADESHSSVRVVKVSPSQRELPANLLRFYIQFSGPIDRRNVGRRVELLDGSGKAVAAAFLEMEDGLFDPEGTRLTVFLHPGRIKRGLRLHSTLGLALKPGTRYRLTFDSQVIKEFEAVAEDHTSPQWRSWKLSGLKQASRDELVITTDEPLDSALLDRCLRVEDLNGWEIKGVVVVDPGEQRWRFLPSEPWRRGEYQIRVSSKLEDRAGNRLTRLFDEPVVEGKPRFEAREVVIPVSVK